MCLIKKTFALSPDVDFALIAVYSLKVRYTNQIVTIINQDDDDEGEGHDTVRGCSRGTRSSLLSP